ncbi:MAG TPA: TRAP transporter substrate-binding protein [Rubrivivax sp.]|nr:TRAP transporter substrate-binding protein [Rubrivivax sp.]
MTRRLFLAGGAAAAASTLAAPAFAQGKLEWKMVTSWPKNAPGTGTAANRIAARITELSAGRLSIKVFGANELVPAFGVFDAVAQGTAELYHSVPSYWVSKLKGIGFFGSFPFGLTAPEQIAWMYHGGGQALYDEVYGGLGIKGFIAGNSGPQAMGWFRKELTKLDDFKGLRIRTAGFAGEMLRRVGAAVVSLPAGEIFQALQAGTIDAAEFVGPWNDAAFGFHQVAKHYHFPGVGEPSSAEEVGFNKGKFEALPADLKAIVRYAIMSVSEEVTTSYDVNHAIALKELVSKHGVKVHEAPRDMLIALGNAAGELMAELREDKDPLTKKVAESYAHFRNQSSEYARYSYAGQMNARLLPIKWG